MGLFLLQIYEFLWICTLQTAGKSLSRGVLQTGMPSKTSVWSLMDKIQKYLSYCQNGRRLWFIFDCRPKLLSKVSDPKLRSWAEELHGLWKSLGRKVCPVKISAWSEFSLVELSLTSLSLPFLRSVMMWETILKCILWYIAHIQALYQADASLNFTTGEANMNIHTCSQMNTLSDPILFIYPKGTHIGC